MENSLASLIPRVSYEEMIASSFSFGPYGFIFSKIMDCVICLPEKLGSSSVIRGHDDSIRLTFKLLYRDYLPLFHKNIDIIKETSPAYVCFVDQAEMIYSIFLASIGEISFLDSTNGDFASGLLFLPSDLSSLSANQIRALYFFLEEIQRKMEKVDFTPSYDAMRLPSFETPYEDSVCQSLEDLQKEIRVLYQNLSKKSMR